MAQCAGKEGSVRCNRTLYRCKHCGNVGCDQASNASCPNQAFSSGRCVKYGKTGKTPA